MVFLKQEWLKDPYRCLFPIGWVLSCVGTLIWTLLYWKPASYPGIFHADIMIGGFLFAYASGFLMTAIPRMTQSAHARIWELTASLCICLGLVGVSLSTDRLIFHSLSLAGLIHIAIFCMRRIKVMTAPYLFILCGLSLGVLGSFGLLLNDVSLLQEPFLSVSRNVYYQGMMLFLVLGVGSRLMPMLLVSGQKHVSAFRSQNVGSSLSPLAIGCALLLCSSFVIESISATSWVGQFVKTSCVTFVVLGNWNLLIIPNKQGYIVGWLWVSAWCIILGLWSCVIFPSYVVHMMHVVYICGIGLMTLMIASRVQIAHGGQNWHESNQKGLFLWTGILILTAGVTRVTAPFVASYVSHLVYAATAWIAAMMIWGVYFYGFTKRVK